MFCMQLDKSIPISLLLNEKRKEQKQDKESRGNVE